MNEHHKESPSKYNAWVQCTHWDSVDKQSNEASAGTHHHQELQKGLENPDYEPDTYVARWAKDEVLGLAGGEKVMSEFRLVGTMPGVEGVYGTADVVWFDADKHLHIADLKSFSDGTEDYIPQLMGYASLWYDKDTAEDIDENQLAVLHVLHGGICKVETVEMSLFKCYRHTIELLKKVRNGEGGYNICKYCQYCSKIKECPMANNAVQVVQGNGAVDFSKMSLPQKLVICDAVEKLCKTLKDEAKQRALENCGVLEADGIRYEIKERAGKGKVRDLCELAGAVNSVKDSMGYEGITSDELLSLCELPKTKFVQAMKDANAERKDVKKKDIETWCAGFYDKGESQPVLTRVK